MILQSFTHAARLGVRSLAGHPLRSGLTTLGIVLGVGSVIVMLAVGEGKKAQALKQFADLGANTIVLKSVKPTDEPDQQKGVDQTAYGLLREDVARIRSAIPTVVDVSPTRDYSKTARYKDRKLEVRIVSITPDYFAHNNITIDRGRGFTSLDEDTFANVVVLGAEAAEKLFPAEDPVGKSVGFEQLDSIKAFIVVGVTAPKTLASGGKDGGGDADFNKVAFMPYTSDIVRLGKDIIRWRPGSFSLERVEIHQALVTVDKMENVFRTAKAIQSVIDAYHPRKDVRVLVPLDLLRSAEESQRTFNQMLAAIACISLLVGGIGIMNIMLATVTERTKEIGVRRALGAKRKDIARQFLVETVILTCAGGIVGIGLGFSLCYLVTTAFGAPTIVQTWSPIVAFAVSLFVGLLSGIMPAWRAARLDPIEALRHE
ncbi:MAG TPA: ABC transporter permease [Fimbriiglobus sp.]|jgi:putative ABC transport system permease protein